MKAIGAGLCALLTTTGSVLAQQTSQPYFHQGHHMWGGGYSWFMGLIMMILFIAIVAALVLLLVRWLGGESNPHSTHPQIMPVKTPLDILKERFAKGDIEKEEFEERRKILE